jgi:hypothetical protein
MKVTVRVKVPSFGRPVTQEDAQEAEILPTLEFRQVEADYGEALLRLNDQLVAYERGPAPVAVDETVVTDLLRAE